MMNQEPRRLNATEIVLPQEVQHESAAHLPALMPSAPLDWPVERFTQALDRREVNRKALLKWIQSNLQAGIDYGQIHFAGKDKCRLAGDGRAHECLDPRHWSKPSLWKPGAEKICGMMGLIPRLSARLYTQNGQPTDLKLIGVLDLVLKDEAGRIIAVDNKTAAKPYAQATVDDGNQLTCYAYLLAANRYVFPTSEVHCRLDVLRKLKTPKLEFYHTVRTADQRRRFAKLASAVLAGIENKVFIPQPSWMCADCPYQDACKAW